ncbi:unnamed protein product, partial [Arabidopsis halleri]
MHSSNLSKLHLHCVEFMAVISLCNHRPKLKLLKDNEEFEKFIERRVTISQVEMCFPYLVRYSRFSHTNKVILSPNAIDIHAMRYESLENHRDVIT